MEPKVFPTLGRGPAGESASTHAYEVFLSCKQTGPDGRPTRDAELAELLEAALEQRGIHCFRADAALQTLARADYSRAIMEAIDRASILVVIGTCPEHVRSPWVRDEWDTFLNEIRSGHKPAGVLVSVLEGMSHADLPIELRQRQCFQVVDADLSRPCEFIERAIGKIRDRVSLQAATAEMAQTGQRARESFDRVDSLSRAMAESRITELEIFASAYGNNVSAENQARIRRHIADIKRILEGS